MQSSHNLNRRTAIFFSLGTIITLSASVAGCGGGSNSITSPGNTRIVSGQSQTINGATVTSWAKLDGTDKVIEAGVTLPFAVLQNPPAPETNHSTRHAGHDHEEGGVGPAGAFVVVGFPDAVKQSTYFDHFEMHWNPAGHPPERYAAPHFDLHFYNDTLDEVRQITAPDTVVPAADRIPEGYVYPGVNETVPEMGVHAFDASEFAPGAPPFSTSMILGYYKGRMNFIEPMVTQAAFLTKQPISVSVPRPAVLGQSTRYPTKFTAVYSPELNVYQCKFSDFVSVNQ
jgi:hypothetical protein